MKRTNASSSRVILEKEPCEPEAKIPKKNESNAIDGLKGCVSALEGSLGVVCQRMSQSLAQSVTMMQNMNNMMEEYVKASIKINLHFERADNHNVKVGIVVKNTCRLPLSNISIKILELEHTQNLEQLDMGCEWNFSQEIEDMKNISTFTITVSFPSPGSGELLNVQHKETIPIQMQYLIEAADNDTIVFQDENAKGKVSPQFLREFLGTNPLDAIDLKCLYKVKDCDLYFRFSQCDEDRALVNVTLTGQDTDLMKLFENTLSSNYI